MARTTKRKSTRKPLAIDCFAGCGGMTQGLKEAGFSVVGAIELDPGACRTYRKNHRGTHLWERDISKVTRTHVLEDLGLKPGDLDLLGGCPPCQGFSTLRTRNGKRRPRDKQNDLIFEFLRLVRSLRPKLVMLENVPALLRNRRFQLFKAALRRAGYQLKADVLNVVDYGVPQRRRRVVLLASRISDVDFAVPIRKKKSVRQTIGKLRAPGETGDSLHDLLEARSEEVRKLIRAIPKNGGSRASLPDSLRLDCHKKLNGFHDVYGRMAWGKPAPTITTGCFNPSKGRFLHPEQNRGISMREAALLQGFPPRYAFPADLGRVRLATLIGNALPPKFVELHAKRLRSLLRPRKSPEKA